jgi:hypothetical protein
MRFVGHFPMPYIALQSAVFQTCSKIPSSPYVQGIHTSDWKLMCILFDIVSASSKRVITWPASRVYSDMALSGYLHAAVDRPEGRDVPQRPACHDRDPSSRPRRKRWLIMTCHPCPDALASSPSFVLFSFRSLRHFELHPCFSASRKDVGRRRSRDR